MRNVKMLKQGLDNTVGKVYAASLGHIDGEMVVRFTDDVGEYNHLKLTSLMAGCWEPTDEEVSHG